MSSDHLTVGESEAQGDEDVTKVTGKFSALPAHPQPRQQEADSFQSEHNDFFLTVQQRRKVKIV